MDASVDPHLSPWTGRPFIIEVDSNIRAVVAHEQHQRVFPQSKLVEPGHQLADVLVQVADHGAEVLLVIYFRFVVGLEVGMTRRRLKRIVREVLGVVDEERPLAIPAHEVEDKLLEQVGTVRTRVLFGRLAISGQDRVLVTVPEIRRLELPNQDTR